jgi:hypothetical protein
VESGESVGEGREEGGEVDLARVERDGEKGEFGKESGHVWLEKGKVEVIEVVKAEMIDARAGGLVCQEGVVGGSSQEGEDPFMRHSGTRYEGELDERGEKRRPCLEEAIVDETRRLGDDAQPLEPSLLSRSEQLEPPTKHLNSISRGHNEGELLDLPDFEKPFWVKDAHRVGVDLEIAEEGEGGDGGEEGGGEGVMPVPGEGRKVAEGEEGKESVGRKRGGE